LLAEEYLGTAYDDTQQPASQSALDACAAFALQRGAMRAVRKDVLDHDEAGAAPQPPPIDDGAVDDHGFNLHASVAVAADDDFGRERLMRYGARPQLALDRLRRLPGGRIGYRIKKLRDGREKVRVMTSLELLARLAAIVPPPRFPLLRYHGVLAPRSPWRRDVVPRAPRKTRCDRPKAKPLVAPAASERLEALSSPLASGPAHSMPRSAPKFTPCVSAAETFLRPNSVAAGDAALLAPNILSVKHWTRLHHGLLYAAVPRVDWATLLRRSFEVDVSQCARCGGPLRVLGEVTEPAMVQLILESFGLSTNATPAARARDPTDFADDGRDFHPQERQLASLHTSHWPHCDALRGPIGDERTTTTQRAPARTAPWCGGPCLISANGVVRGAPRGNI
jgi:hypothetical protein